MKQMVCSVCTFTYDEAKGIPDAGIAPGTRWEDLPDDWKCPWCGAGKDAFREKKEAPAASVTEEAPQPQPEPEPERELSAMEMSIVCSNLARGCEKQYLPEQAEDFKMLADYFREKEKPRVTGDFGDILKLIESDLSAGYPSANAAASGHEDRGALRALVWSEKVTRMLQSVLRRYESEGERMLENTGVFVCTICGFIYIGDSAPQLCPVCKVPEWKFEKIERRA